MRSVLAHRVRLILTAVSAVLGVAFVAGTLILTAALDRTFTDIFTSTATDISVTAASALGEVGFGDAENPSLAGFVPQAVVDVIAGVPGVADAAGTATGPGVAILTAEGEVLGGSGPPALGLTWLSNPALSNARITQGREPAAPGEVVVDEITFPRLGLPLGAPLQIAAPDGRISAVLVGVFSLGSTGGQAGLSLTAFVPQQAQELLTAPGAWSSAVVEVEPGSTNAQVAQAIGEAIGPGYRVTTREEQVDAAVTALRQGLGFVTTIISVFAGIALFVAAFLIYNTFSMLIAQRGREMALLRAVGATRWQILGSVMVEALIIALIAAVLGLLVGLLLARGLTWLLSLTGLDISSGIGLNTKAVVWALALSVLVTTVSAAVPAVRASRIPPVAALRDAGRPAETAGVWRTLLGAALAAACGVGLWRAFEGALEALQTAWASAGLLLAGILLAPALARVFAGAVTGLLGVIAGVPGRIAGRNASRAPRRVAATAAALMIGLALVSGVSVIVASAQQSLSDLVDRTFIGDLLITRDGRVFSPDIAPAVAAVDGVGLVVAQTSGPAQLADGQLVNVSAVGLAGDSPALAAVLGGASPQDLAAGRAVLGQSRAAELGLAVGDSVSLLLPSGQTMTQTVAAVVADNPLLGDLVVPADEYRAAGGEADDRAVFVAFDGSVPREQVDAAVREVVDVNPLLSVLSQTQLKERNQEQLDRLLYLVFAMLGLSIIIAGLGVVNTMALSVVERTREIGLLRAVGASRRQVRRMIRWEAVLVSVLGGLLGVVVGVLIGVALQRALAGDGLDVLAVPWSQLAWVFAAAVLMGVFGAVLPARRASRLDILQAIGRE